MKAVTLHKEEVGVARACVALAVPRSSYYRNMLPAKAQKKRGRPARALSEDEKKGVLGLLISEEFCDQVPRQIWATLLDRGKFLAHWRTMYRILEENQLSKERRNQLRHPEYEAPELLATRPNEVWSWDITRMRGPAKWSCFYLYVIMDIFSRYVVGWMIAQRESAVLAKELIEVSCQRQGVERNSLTIHSDRGPSMTSKTVAQLLVDLEIEKSLSRPHVSNDNPYSEAQFKTMKYRPDYPKRFGSIEDARGLGTGILRLVQRGSSSQRHRSASARRRSLRRGRSVPRETNERSRGRLRGPSGTFCPRRSQTTAASNGRVDQQPVETDRAAGHAHKNEVVIQSKNRPETGDGRSGSTEILILKPSINPKTLLGEAKTKTNA